MLEFLRIQRFKTLGDSQFPLAPLNVLTGLNGMGKSSVIQSLLLLRQSYERAALSRGLLLNGPYLSLGLGSSIFPTSAKSETIEFLIKDQVLGKKHFSFKFEPDLELQPALDPSTAFTDTSLADWSLFNRNFQYLSADRINPATQHLLSDYSLNQLNSLGNHGEYTVHFLAEQNRKQFNNSGLAHEGADADTFSDHLNAWMSEITPGLEVRTKILRSVNAAQLSFAFKQGNEMTAEFQPQNVGFGLTYVLPVVTALLRAQPGDLLFIENPESHLHPAGQSAIGQLSALAAANGVQLILETHSDHFFNGIRVAVKQKKIDPDKVRFFFLDRNSGSLDHTSTVESPELDEQGRISFWPKGFFDERTKSLELLL